MQSLRLYGGWMISTTLMNNARILQAEAFAGLKQKELSTAKTSVQ
jgi:hypothetical protein